MFGWSRVDRIEISALICFKFLPIFFFGIALIATLKEGSFVAVAKNTFPKLPEPSTFY